MAKEPGFTGMHKMKPFCFGNIVKKRITESLAMQSNRKQQRASNFNCNRNITDGDNEESSTIQKRKGSPQADRKVLLARWKEERELLKNKTKEKQKPLFKVGIVHHNVASPIFRDISNEKSITKNKNVGKTQPKKRNNSSNKIEKNDPTSSTSKNNEKIQGFNKKTSTENASVKPTVLKTNVSPVSTFPFNKQNFAFCFKHASNKKLTEPHSPSFMQRKRTQMNQKPLLKKPLFLTAKDGEVKDENQFAYSLSDNLSVHEQEYALSSCDHNKKQSTNESDKPLFLTSNSKDINEEQLAHRLSNESSLQEQQCAKTSHNHNMEQNISEYNKPVFSTSKNTEIDEEQLAHRLSDNSSVQGQKHAISNHDNNVEHEQEYAISSCDHNKKQSTNESDKPLFLTSKSKDINEEQLAHRLSDESLLQEQKCAKSGHNHSMEQNISENNKPVFLTSKDTEIDEEQLAHRLSDNSSVQGQKYAISSHNHNVEKNVNEPIFSTSKDKEVDNEHLEHKLTENSSVQELTYTVASCDQIHDLNLTKNIEKSAGMNGKLGNSSTEVELSRDMNCSDTTNENFIMSPNVTVHRGKKRWHSRGWRRRVSAEMPGVTDECKNQSPNSVIIEYSKFHRNQLDQETGRLLSLADDWEKTALVEEVPSSIADEIAGIVGQTRLLTRDKFQQFRSLIEQFENNDGPVKITADDLTGFWEMIYLQVEKLNRSYNRLEEMRNNKWQEKATVPIKRRKTVVKTAKPVAKSRFRDFIQEKKMSELRSENSVHTGTSEPTETLESSACTPTSVPIKVISSESVKRYSSSFSPAAFAAMNSSLLGKALGHSPAIVVHRVEGSATPKSILKKKQSQSVTHRKKTVLFGEDWMAYGVRRESDSECDDRSESTTTDQVITANDQVGITNVLNKTEDVTSTILSSNDPAITTDDQVVITSDPVVSANDTDVITTEQLVTVNSPLNTSNNPLTTNFYTPRRSARLASKIVSSSSKVLINTPISYTDDKNTVTIQNSASVSENPIKKFFLKPSSLSINPEELIKSNVEKAQKSKNKRALKSKCEQLDVVDYCITESCESALEPSINTRRSKRLLQKESDIHRTVTFESGFSERSSSHYRKTPYKKRSRKSFSTEDE